MIRDLTKSMLSFSWAMSLFGVEQLTNTLIPQRPSQPNHRATTAFNAVTQTTEEQLSGVLKGVFNAGDQLQRGMVDLMFGFLSLEAFNPSQMMRMTSDMLRQTTGAFGQGFQRGPSTWQPEQGWGPVPPQDTSTTGGVGAYAAPDTSETESRAGWRVSR